MNYGKKGASDGAFIMQKKKRTDNIATLDIVGCDQQDQKLTIEFDREHCVWNFKKAETELWKEPVDEVLEIIAKFMQNQEKWKGTATELLNCLYEIDMQPNKLTKKLNISVEKLYVDYQIVYKSSRGHDGRMISLEKLKSECVDSINCDNKI